MRFSQLALAVMLSLIGAATEAQIPDDISRCRSIEDDSRRLDCYDAISLPPVSLEHGKYEVVPLAELKDFALSFRGRFVEVSGWVTPARDFLFLKLDEQDATSIPVEFRALPRHLQESFLEQCGTGCGATIQGRVAPVNFTTGIVAEQLSTD